jgi:hypothetical protein
MLCLGSQEIYHEIFSDTFQQKHISHTIHTEKHIVQQYTKPYSHTPKPVLNLMSDSLIVWIILVTQLLLALGSMSCSNCLETAQHSCVLLCHCMLCSFNSWPLKNIDYQITEFLSSHGVSTQERGGRGTFICYQGIRMYYPCVNKDKCIWDTISKVVWIFYIP